MGGSSARGLRALLGPAVGAQAPCALLLLLFGRSEMRARRLQARLVYARSLALSLELGCRYAVVSAFAALADEDLLRGQGFAAESVTAAIAGALRLFGVEGIPSVGAARRLRGPLWRRGDDDDEESERSDDDDDDDDGSGDESEGGDGSPADADGDTDGGGGDGDGDGGDAGSLDGADDGADADEFSFLELGGGARAHRSRMCSLVCLFASAQLEATVTLAALPSAALWRAVQPSRPWLDATVLAGGCYIGAVLGPWAVCVRRHSAAGGVFLVMCVLCGGLVSSSDVAGFALCVVRVRVRMGAFSAGRCLLPLPCTTSPPRWRRRSNNDRAAMGRETAAMERETAAIARELAATDSSDRARFGTGTTRDWRDVALRSTRVEIDRDARSA